MGNEKKTNYLSFVINYNIILLIPMLIVVLSTYFVVKEHNLQRVMTEAKLKTESQSKYWEQEMSVLAVTASFTALHTIQGFRSVTWISCRI